MAQSASCQNKRINIGCVIRTDDKYLWQHLTLFKVYDSSWQFLTVSDSIWQYLTVFDMLFRLSPWQGLSRCLSAGSFSCDRLYIRGQATWELLWALASVQNIKLSIYFMQFFWLFWRFSLTQPLSWLSLLVTMYVRLFVSVPGPALLSEGVWNQNFWSNTVLLKQ